MPRNRKAICEELEYRADPRNFPPSSLTVTSEAGASSSCLRISERYTQTCPCRRRAEARQFTVTVGLSEDFERGGLTTVVVVFGIRRLYRKPKLPFFR